MSKEEIIQNSIAEHELKFPDKVKAKVQDVILDCMTDYVSKAKDAFEQKIADLKGKIESSSGDASALEAIKGEIDSLKASLESGPDGDRDAIINDNIEKHDLKFPDKVKDKVFTVINDCIDKQADEEKQLLEGGLVTLNNFYEETLSAAAVAPEPEPVAEPEPVIEETPAEPEPVVESVPEAEAPVEEVAGDDKDAQIAALTAEVASLKNQLAEASAPREDGGMDSKLMQLEIDELKKKLADAEGGSAEGGADTSALDAEIASLKDQLAQKDKEIESLKTAQESDEGEDWNAMEESVAPPPSSQNIITLDQLLKNEKSA